LSDRIAAIQRWVRQRLDWPDAVFEPASADASFRRYFRVQQGGASYIVMDAPPDKEDCAPFIHVTELFLAAGLHVPEILAKDLQQGLLLLSDLGNRPYLDALNEDSVDRLYGDALGALATTSADINLTSLISNPAGFTQLFASLDKLFGHMVAIATPELAQPLGSMQRVWNQMATIDPRAADAESRAGALIASPEVQAANDALGAWVTENCA